MKPILVCCIVWLFGTCARAQGYQLIVTVVDDKNKPLSGATVLLDKRNATPIAHENGIYVLKNITSGEYRLIINMEGLKPVRKKISINNHDVSAQITLHPNVHILEEVIVHNNNIQQRKSHSDLNLEIVKSDFIQKNLGGSLMQSLEKLPGVKMIGIGSGQSKPMIRGLGFNRVVVVDKGIKHEGQQWGADHGLEIDQFAADEVEIVKGAASFSYGSDAIAGIIKVNPPEVPVPHTFGGNIDLTGKTNNALYGTSVNLYGRTQKWLASGRVTWQDYGDYRVPADRLYVYDFAVDLYRHHLRNTAGRERDVHLTIGYVNDFFKSVFYVSNVYNKSGFFANAHGLEPRRVDASLYDRSSRDIQMPYQTVNHLKVINKSSLRVANHKLDMELGFQNNFRQEYNHYVNHGYMPAVYPSDMKIPATLEREFNKNVYSINVKDAIRWASHDLKYGISGEVQLNTVNGWSFLVPAFDQKSIAAFVYDGFIVNSKTLLHGALRYDYSSIDIHQYKDWFTSPYDQNNTTNNIYVERAQKNNRNFNSITGSVGLNYSLKYIEFKANIGKSFRMPIAKELGANGVNYHYFSYEKGNANLSPESSYQLDLTGAFAKNKWRVQLSPFVNYFSNYIYLNPTANYDYLYGAGNQIFEYTQSRALRYGGEVEINYQPWETLSTSVMGEYLYARQLSGNKKGYTLPFSPPASVLLNVTYQPIHFGPFKRTYYSIDYRITAPQNNIVPPEKKTAGYALINLQAGTRFFIQNQSVRLSIQLQNALNTRYLNHTSFYRLIGLPEQGRNWVLSASIPFNFLKNKHKI